jgi:hypothetical protein
MVPFVCQQIENKIRWCSMALACAVYHDQSHSGVPWPVTQRCTMTSHTAVYHDQSHSGVSWPVTQRCIRTSHTAVYHDQSHSGVSRPVTQRCIMTSHTAVYHDQSHSGVSWPVTQQLTSMIHDHTIKFWVRNMHISKWLLPWACWMQYQAALLRYHSAYHGRPYFHNPNSKL